MKALSIFAPTLMVLFFVSGVLLSSPAFSDYWWVYEHDLTEEDLNFIDIGGVFAVGDNGVVLECLYPLCSDYDPEWQDISPPTSEDLYGECYGWFNEYVVGTSGIIICYSEHSWTFDNSPTTKDLYSISISRNDNEVGFVVGEDGTIIFADEDPPEWELYESSPTSQDLYSVCGDHDNPNSTWAVGAGGTIIDYEDGVWSLYPSSPTTEDLYGVYVNDYFDLTVACGAAGTIILWDGASWNVVDTPTTEDLFSIQGPAWALFCVGANGTILFSYDGGQSWEIEDCPVYFDLHGVARWGEYVWAVGDNGTILSRDPIGSIQPISVGKVKALFAPSVEAFGSTDDVK